MKPMMMAMRQTETVGFVIEWSVGGFSFDWVLTPLS
jgi:hypothetical protein